MKKKSEMFYTIGHSTRNIEEFISILQSFGIKTLVDIRTLPGSKAHPQFNLENLSKSLEKNSIRYMHRKALGGLRRPKKDSINLGWRNASFRGYADYMQTQEFWTEIDFLIELSNNSEAVPIALMCAEAVPWRCHRSLVADALMIRGFEIGEIFDLEKSRPHKMTDFAEVNGTHLSYPLTSALRAK